MMIELAPWWIPVHGARPASESRVPRMLPPRSTAGQLTLDQHIGVRIPGGQPQSSNPV